jgi:hypothetical protein
MSSQPDQKFVVPSTGKPAKKRRSSTSLLAGAVLAVAVLGYGLTSWMTPSDRISEQEKAAIETQFASLKSLQLAPVQKQDVQSALQAMPLQPDARQALANTLLQSKIAERIENIRIQAQGSGAQGAAATSGTVALAEITLSDFASQDGDVVLVSSGGYEIEVALLNQLKPVTIPVDASGTITITGLRDGGGGITAAIHGPSGMVRLPVRSPGQAITIPVNL